MITYHHIGGRNGTFPLPLKKGALLKDLHLTLYDADINCFEQMKLASQNEWGQLSIYPYCIGNKTGSAKFHLNFHPTSSSLYHFNDSYKDYTYIDNPLYGEYVLGDAYRNIKDIDLEVFTLEDALRISGTSNIDYLSLDVQGAEYDVLDGARTFIQENCVGIHLEVEFVEVYKNQKIFSDIHSLLNDLDFELLELEKFGRCAPMSLPIGFRGLEQPIYGEAVYVKKINNLVKDENVDQLYKGAFFSLIYKKLGMCLKFLTKINEIEKIERETKNNQYINLLREIWLSYNEYKQIKLPTISQLFSHEKFQNYYGLKQDQSMADKNHNLIQEQMKVLSLSMGRLKEENFSPLEKILMKYELNEVAAQVKKKRLFETSIAAELSL